MPAGGSPTKSLPRAQSARRVDGCCNSPGPSPPRPICPTTRPAARSTTRITCWRDARRWPDARRYARSPQVATRTIIPEGTPAGHVIVIRSSITAGRPRASTAYCLGSAQAVISAAPSSPRQTNCRWEPTMDDLRRECPQSPITRHGRPCRLRVVRIAPLPSRATHSERVCAAENTAYNMLTAQNPCVPIGAPCSEPTLFNVSILR